MNFNTGNIYISAAIAFKASNESEFFHFLNKSIRKYMNCEWGNDVLINNNAVINGERILASYQYQNTKIWIITEYDRSMTTILFPEEY